MGVRVTFEKGHQVVIKINENSAYTHPSMWAWENILSTCIDDVEYVAVDGHVVWPFKEERRLR